MPETPKIRVLIADDHSVVRRGMKELLDEDPELEVCGEATDGREALSMLKSGLKADVLLTDISMPNMDGLELAKAVNNEFPEIRIVLLTMQEEDGFVQKAFEAGIKNYLFKTADPEEVIFAVKRALTGKPYISADLSDRLIKRAGSLGGTKLTDETLSVEFSGRELEVLQLMSEGFTNEEVADKLCTSRRTVEGYRQAMIDKSGCRNSLSLIRFAMQHGLLQ